MRTANILMIVFCIVFCGYAEWQVYQHYLVINRDFYPVMSDFYKMYAERALNCFAQVSACLVGIRAKGFITTIAA